MSDDWLKRRAEFPYGLESRDEIGNYMAWQADMFLPLVEGPVVDHGAGTGALSAALLVRGVEAIIAVEPDPVLLDTLNRRFASEPRVRVFGGTLEDLLEESGPKSAGCVVSSNVIEHIADDSACLRTMWKLLKPGRSVGLYVPARPELFGALYEVVGHHRRYRRRDLVDAMQRAGFDVRVASYRNVLGVLPWLVTGRLLRRTTVSSGSLWIYDKALLPIFRAVEDRFPPPYGLNLFAVGDKRP